MDNLPLCGSSDRVLSLRQKTEVAQFLYDLQGNPPSSEKSTLAHRFSMTSLDNLPLCGGSERVLSSREENRCSTVSLSPPWTISLSAVAEKERPCSVRNPTKHSFSFTTLDNVPLCGGRERAPLPSEENRCSTFPL